MDRKNDSWRDDLPSEGPLSRFLSLFKREPDLPQAEPDDDGVIGSLVSETLSNLSSFFDIDDDNPHRDY